MSTLTNDRELGLQERIGALASAVDGLYDEIQTLTHRSPGELTNATAQLATLIADAQRLLPSAAEPAHSRGELELWLAGHTG